MKRQTFVAWVWICAVVAIIFLGMYMEGRSKDNGYPVPPDGTQYCVVNDRLTWCEKP